MLHKYQSEPIRPALILLLIVAVVVVLLPPPVRVVGAFFFSGPVAWALLQSLRNNRGVTVTPQQITLFGCLTRRTTIVPVGKIQGWRVNGRDQLLIAWNEERNKADDPDDERPPRLRLFATAALDDPRPLIAALPAQQPLTPGQMGALIGMRRVRRSLVWLGVLFVVLPVIVFSILRVWAALTATRQL